MGDDMCGFQTPMPKESFQDGYLPRDGSVNGRIPRTLRQSESEKVKDMNLVSIGYQYRKHLSPNERGRWSSMYEDDWFA
jgi:hypothetical protein